MPPTEGNKKLLSMYDSVSRDLGFGPVTAVDPRRAGAADISYVADHVEMAVQLYEVGRFPGDVDGALDGQAGVGGVHRRSVVHAVA